MNFIYALVLITFVSQQVIGMQQNDIQNSVGVIGYRCQDAPHEKDWVGTAFVTRKNGDEITISTATHVYNAIREDINNTCQNNGRIFFITQGRFNQPPSHPLNLTQARNALGNPQAMVFCQANASIRVIDENGNPQTMANPHAPLNDDEGRDVVFINFQAPNLPHDRDIIQWPNQGGGNSIHGGLITATNQERKVCQDQNLFPCFLGFPGEINNDFDHNPLKKITWCRANTQTKLLTQGNNGLDRRVMNGGVYNRFLPGDLTINPLENHLNAGASGGPHFCARIDVNANLRRITQNRRVFSVHTGINAHKHILMSKIFRTDLP